MARLLHLADVHLAAAYSAFGALAEERRAAVLAAFRQLPEHAARLEVDAVAIAGDLFDGPQPPVEARSAVAEVSRRLGQQEQPLLIVPGNHDSQLFHPNPWADPPENVLVFLDPAFGPPVVVNTHAGALNVYGVAYDPAREEDPLGTYRRAARPGFHVVLLHGSVRDAPHWTAGRHALRLLPEELERLEADYVALGDHHRPRPPEQFALTVPTCYAGSFAAVDLTETGPRGFVVVELEEGKPPRVEHHSSGVREVVDSGTVDVGGWANEAEIVDAVVARTAENGIPVVALGGVPAFPLDVEQVTQGLERRFGHARVVDTTSYFSSGRLDEVALQDSIAGHLVRLGRERIARLDDERERRVADRALRIALRELGVE